MDTKKSEVLQGTLDLMITKRGLKQLAIETQSWERISGLVGRVLRIAERG